jgi:cytidine deaminase
MEIEVDITDPVLLSHAVNSTVKARQAASTRKGSAVAEMVRNGETRISKIVATTAEGTILPPCGRCRPLRELLPDNWQTHFDKPLPGQAANGES